ncbi:hypothetical protein BD413DRAFT_617048 [Trametes elegans]|nr:hypothetical protein BD413DRAFT_617048 [Trametes elegans]
MPPPPDDLSLLDVAAELPATTHRDADFYCEDIIFLVDDVLFKVSRKPFERDSEVFRDMFSLPSPRGNIAEVDGMSDQRPLVLGGIGASEFRAFLNVIFPITYGTTRRVLDKGEWLHVLRLAEMWGFEAVRKQAVRELSRLVSQHAERFALAHQFSIPGWIEPALQHLARQDTLSAEDFRWLGWETAARLVQVRDSVVFAHTCLCVCNYCKHAHDPAAVHSPNPGASESIPPSSSRMTQMGVATLRRKTDFTAHIREVFSPSELV